MSPAQVIAAAIADLHLYERMAGRINIDEYDGGTGTAADDHDGAHPADSAYFGAL
jgi:hypothetical protein